MSPITDSRYYIQDEWGEILVETDNYESALRSKFRYEQEGKNVHLIDLQKE